MSTNYEGFDAWLSGPPSQLFGLDRTGPSMFDRESTPEERAAWLEEEIARAEAELESLLRRRMEMTP